MKKLLSIACVLAIVLAMAGCGKNTGPASATTPGVTVPGATNAPPAEVDFSKTDADMFTDRDKRTQYTETDCIRILLEDSSAKTSDASVKVNGSTVTVTKEGTYLISGALSDGSLVVNAPEDAKLQLIFDGVNISSATSAALYIEKADKVFLTLTENSENTLSNGGSFAEGDSIDAVLFSKEDLTLNGSGKLTVTSPAGHGIVCKDDLVLTGGNYTVSAASHGLDANDSIRICSSSLSVEAGKDGLHAENNEDMTLGFIYITDSTLTLRAEGDGISAGAFIQAVSGAYDIVAGGGYENGNKSHSDNYGGFPGGFGGGGFPGGGRPPRSVDTAEETTDSTSMKGFKAGTGMLLCDGSYVIDAADDAFHSNQALTANGGSFSVKTGDDAFHAETALTITGGNLDVAECYEGLEAEKIYVSGGNMKLNCSDDGLNAAGGTDGSGAGGRDGQFGGGFGGGRPGGFGGGFGNVNADALISVSGGEITIYSGGDGLDSNGNLTISGGNIRVYNPKSGDTSVLDSDIKPVITGGSYIGLGITTNMAETFDANKSTQGFIACSTGGLSAGMQISVTDSSGNTVLTCTTEYSTALLILSCPQIVKGQTYTLTAGTQTGQVTAS